MTRPCRCSAVRTHSEILPALVEAANNLRTLGDLGYEGESDTITVAFKKPKGGRLTAEQQQLNKAHNSLRAIGERRNSLLEMTFKALRNVGLDPWRIGKIVAAALVCPTSTTPEPHDHDQSSIRRGEGSWPAVVAAG